MSRLWGIRHLRYWWLKQLVYRTARMYYEHGIGTGEPNPADLLYLERVRRGEA